jgi:L-lactate permease
LFIIFSLTLSLTLFTMINKRHTSLLSVKMVPVTLKHGKIYTFESKYWWFYLLVITFNRILSLFIVLCCYMWQQWKWKSTSIFSFLQKNAKEHIALYYKHDLEQVYSFQKVRTMSCWVLYFLNNVNLISFFKVTYKRRWASHGLPPTVTINEREVSKY